MENIYKKNRGGKTVKGQYKEGMEEERERENSQQTETNRSVEWREKMRRKGDNGGGVWGREREGGRVERKQA